MDWNELPPSVLALLDSLGIKPDVQLVYHLAEVPAADFLLERPKVIC